MRSAARPVLAFTLVVALVAACAEGARVESPPRASSAPAVPMSQPSAQLVQPAVSAAPEPAPAQAEDGGAGDGGVLFPDADQVVLGLRTPSAPATTPRSAAIPPCRAASSSR